MKERVFACAWPSVAALLFVGTSACLESRLAPCADGIVCPADMRCDDAHGGCVSPDQLSVCTGRPDGTPCTTGDIEGGACDAEVCVPGGCGNGGTDILLGEECDDGNAIAHDGCHQCLREDAVWTEIHTGSTPDWVLHAAAYDASRGRIVLFSGSALAVDMWELDGPRWVRITPAGARPSGRHNHTLAYDSTKLRTVLFGGYPSFSDTWEWDGSSWNDVSPSGPHPAARFQHAMAYDPVRQRLVVFGGLLGQAGSYDVLLGDTWEWDGEAWRDVTPATASPSPRTAHAMTYDAHTGRVVLFGGVTGDDRTPLSDTWEWDGSSWVEATPANVPPPRWNHALSYDGLRQRIVLFGGQDGPEEKDDLWEWDGSNWQLPSINGSKPAPRFGHTAVYDIARKQTVFIGGSSGGTTPRDIWAWDGASFQEWQPIGDDPEPRQGGAVAFAKDYALLFGGGSADDGSLHEDTLRWNGLTWALLDGFADAPSARTEATMTYDAARDQLVLFGGTVGGAILDETWIFANNDWALVDVTGALPPARSNAAAAYRSASSEVVIFGGDQDNTLLDDTWLWNGSEWTEAIVDEKPSPRMDHAMAYDIARDRVVLYGGKNATQVLSDVWEWDGQRWREVTPVGIRPVTATDMQMSYDANRRRVILFGGQSISVVDEVWEWDGSAWTPIFTPGATPPPRGNHMQFYDPLRGAVTISGGANEDGPLGDTWALQYRRKQPYDTCLFGVDVDRDGLVGCEDPECWAVCTPGCPPGAACASDSPRCGDGTCNTVGDSYCACPQDCDTCDDFCGNLMCSADEDDTSCPSDC